MMRCPACSAPLPFYCAFAETESRNTCPACGGQFAPTASSHRKIQMMSIFFSFIAGIPLGIGCGYLWLVSGKPVLAVAVLLVGGSLVVGSCYLYAREKLRFRIVLPDL